MSIQIGSPVVYHHEDGHESAAIITYLHSYDIVNLVVFEDIFPHDNPLGRVNIERKNNIPNRQLYHSFNGDIKVGYWIELE